MSGLEVLVSLHVTRSEKRQRERVHPNIRDVEDVKYLNAKEAGAAFLE